MIWNSDFFTFVLPKMKLRKNVATLSHQATFQLHTRNFIIYNIKMQAKIVRIFGILRVLRFLNTNIGCTKCYCHVMSINTQNNVIACTRKQITRFGPLLYLSFNFTLMNIHIRCICILLFLLFGMTNRATKCRTQRSFSIYMQDVEMGGAILILIPLDLNYSSMT